MKLKNVMTNIRKKAEQIGMPLLIGGFLTIGAILMFGGFLTTFALGVLTNVLIALSLAYVAYLATAYVSQVISRLLTPNPTVHTKNIEHGLSRLAGLGVAAAVLGVGIGLTATTAWLPLTLPLALSIVITVVAAFSLSLLVKATFKSGVHLVEAGKGTGHSIRVRSGYGLDLVDNTEIDPAAGQAYSYQPVLNPNLNTQVKEEMKEELNISPSQPW